ncbi:MAG: tetratricopeptide repeat protein [Vampirovibrio sp.]|nr:tetratricopeptide repeat protein [Vampirovibrio sp.]
MKFISSSLPFQMARAPQNSRFPQILSVLAATIFLSTCTVFLGFEANAQQSGNYPGYYPNPGYPNNAPPRGYGNYPGNNYSSPRNNYQNNYNTRSYPPNQNRRPPNTYNAPPTSPPSQRTSNQPRNYNSVGSREAAQYQGDYVSYTNQAERFTKQGELSKAIGMYLKAKPLAPDSSISFIHNNLAVLYMKRGNYYLGQARDKEKALSDFRNAHYMIVEGWPAGLKRRQLHEDNIKIAEENLKIAYSNLKIDPKDKVLHEKMAQELRLKGLFQEALVEYAQVAEIDPKADKALMAMGDLFNVLNLPDKSNIYYGKAADALGEGASDDLLVRLASAQNKSGQLDSAIANLNLALDKNPQNVAALNQLEQIWRNELKFRPNSVLAHANLGSIFQKRKQFTKAEKAYETAEYFANQDPSTSIDTKKLIRLNMGTLYQETKNFRMARNAYQSILQIDPSSKQAQYYIASLYKDMGQTDKAATAYNNLLAVDPEYAPAHEALLDIIHEDPNPASKKHKLLQYANTNSSNAQVQSKVGEELHKLKEYNDAVTHYERAIKLKPDMAAAYANMGAALQALDRDDEALEAFHKATQLDPNNDTVLALKKDVEQASGLKAYNRALEMQQQGNHQDALPLFKKAISQAPNNPEFHAGYGISLQNLNRLHDAVTQYQKALNKDPKNADYHYFMATAYHQNQQYDKAMESYRKVKALGSSSYQAETDQALEQLNQVAAGKMLAQAVEAYNKRSYSKALTLINSTLKEDSANATAHYYKGLILSGQNKESQAVQSYEAATRHDPEFKDAYYALGVSLDKIKNSVKAKAAFEKFLKLSVGTEDDFVKYAQHRVNTIE